MSKVVFKHSDQACVDPKLLKAVTQACNAYGKDAECSAGFRTLECQKATAILVLAKNPGSYQLPNGAVYIKVKLKNGKTETRCLASAYGESNHCFRIAMDMNGWFEELTNAQLKPYGLCKPVSYEPWHVQLIETIGISKAQKIAIRDSYQKEESSNMDVKAFQSMTGLTADGVVGPKTKENAKEVMQCCQKILGLDFKTAEEALKICMSNPKQWIDKLPTQDKKNGEIAYFDKLIMNIVNKMGGEK